MDSTIRKPIITVLGHVDHGKTSFLDKVRGTAIAEREAGKITQHIGATEVPIEAIQKISGNLVQKFGFQLKIDGLLFIDTPGHEAFTNLRKRGGSIADLAVLVVDITQGFQPQTLEAVEILKTFKTPFLVAANKIDLIREWDSREGSFLENVKLQDGEALRALDEKIYQLVGKLHELGFQSERLDRCADFTKQVPIIPMSARTGEGIPEVLVLLAGLSQKFLEKSLRITVSGAGKAQVLERKEEKGLGKTIDVILYDGSISVGEEIVLAGMNGLIQTKVRALLVPKPLNEIRDPSERFQTVKTVYAAAGIKIVAPNLDEALPGSPLLVSKTGSEAIELQKEVESMKIHTEGIGPIVKTDALGSLEAIASMLKQRGLTPKKADVGAVSKRDVMEAMALKEKDPYKAVLFAFNTAVKPEALEEAQRAGIPVFQDKVVYALLNQYDDWVEEEKQKAKQAVLEKIVFPCKLEFLRGFVFRNSKPAVIGVKVLVGRLKNNIPLMSERGKIGNVKAIQSNGKSVEQAKSGEEVAVSIDDAIVGKTVFEGETLYSAIPKSHWNEIHSWKSLFSDSENELLGEILQLQQAIKSEEKA